ncbi:MAG: hypothetical protein ABR573_09950 [Candidatus Dormibacteria bacterium]
MRWVRPQLLLATALVPALLAGCGGGGGSAGGGGDPVAVASGYANAVKGNPKGGLGFLVTESTEKVTGDTTLSRFMAANKGATPKVATISWIPVGGSTAVPSQKECLVGQPLPSQICIVTLEVTGGKPSPAYFHVVVENRYGGKWQIINVDMVDKAPDNLLPSGNEAHKG